MGSCLARCWLLIGGATHLYDLGLRLLISVFNKDDVSPADASCGPYGAGNVEEHTRVGDTSATKMEKI